MVMSIVMLVVAGAVGWFSRAGKSPPDDPQADPQHVVQAGQQRLKAMLDVPESVVFSQTWAARLSADSPKLVACGHYRARKANGGPTGELRFIATPDVVIAAGDNPENAAALDTTWSQACLSRRVWGPEGAVAR